jgi:hypothetical protein
MPLVRYAFLKEKGIITNRMQLARAIQKYGFPQPLEIGTNTLAWRWEEIEAWIDSRPRRIPKVWDGRAKLAVGPRSPQSPASDDAGLSLDGTLTHDPKTRKPAAGARRAS